MLRSVKSEEVGGKRVTKQSQINWENILYSVDSVSGQTRKNKADRKENKEKKYIREKKKKRETLI